jgi:hypothetical protein
MKAAGSALLNMVAASAFVTLGCLSSLAHDAHNGRYALGDGRISTSPRIDHVMACNTRFPGGGGAHRQGTWISGKTWTRAGKPTVEGSVPWPSASVSITVEGSERVVRANGLPLHATGTFPIRPGSLAYSYDRNPNRIMPGSVLLRLPAEPKAAAAPACVPMGMIGFTVAGVAIFNAFDLGGRDAPAYEIQDACNGHPERSGVYHYHDWSPCIAGQDHPANRPVGWMLDGFPILGPRDASGRLVTNADLDECHGRVGTVEIDGQPVTMYHYRFTMEFPYTIGCFRGTPIRLTSPDGPPRGPGSDQRARILENAAKSLNVDPDALRAAVGPPPPDFRRAAQRLGLPEADIRRAFDAARAAAERRP